MVPWMQHRVAMRSITKKSVRLILIWQTKYLDAKTGPARPILVNQIESGWTSFGIQIWSGLTKSGSRSGVNFMRLVTPVITCSYV